jgi:hypothetical protein
MNCTACGGSLMQFATAWGPRRGTFRHGQSHRDATAFEQPTPERHCCCPGGPVWRRLESTEVGRAMRLRETRHERSGVVHFWMDGSWYEQSAADWRRMLTEQWETLLGSVAT